MTYSKGRRVLSLKPAYMRRHETFESYMQRLFDGAKLLSTKGGVTFLKALETLTNENRYLNEKAARFLRKELSTLRALEKKGGANVRLRRAVSRLEIADVALTLLENAGPTVGENLFCLLEELLNIDRHRAYMTIKNSAAKDKAAAIDANHLINKKKLLGVRALAKLVLVSPSTVTEWRRSQTYTDLVYNHRRAATISSHNKMIQK